MEVPITLSDRRGEGVSKLIEAASYRLAVRRDPELETRRRTDQSDGGSLDGPRSS
jgi:hypothetical protein